MNEKDIIAFLAADVMINDDPTLIDYAALDDADRDLLIRDYRDEFASSPLPALADARIDDTMINMIRALLDARC